MSTVPAEITGLGSTALKLRQSPGFDPLKAALGPDEYFVFTRMDGVTSIRDVIVATGLPTDRAVNAVVKLRGLGGLLLPNEASPPPLKPAAPAKPVPAPAPVAQPAVMRPSPARPVGPNATTPPATAPAYDLSLPNPTSDELLALGEVNDLTDKERRLILAMARVARDPHALLGVTANADARTLKFAYFKISKDVHPDRYYGKQLGTFAERLAATFEASTRAYTRLTSGDKSRASGAIPAVRSEEQQAPQTPTEYAAELFDKACDLEVKGDALGAMQLFAAAVRVDPQVRYLRRAASCALAAEQPKTALEYAKKVSVLAPNDPSAARILASAFKAGGKLADAEEVLVMAMAIKSENDTLAAELRNDLADVRRLIAQGG